MKSKCSWRLLVILTTLAGSTPCHAQAVITTVAGRPGPQDSGAFSGDGGPATSADLQSPRGVKVDAAGNLYIADTGNYRIRKVTAAGIISTVAGNGSALPSPDGGQATDAGVSPAQIAGGGVAVDNSGNVYFSDVGISWRVRKVDSGGMLTTIAGNGLPVFSGDGGPARNAGLTSPGGLAGNGTPGFSGDGGAATAASLQAPVAVAVDSAGNLYIVDQTPHRVRKVDTSGIIRTHVVALTPDFATFIGRPGMVPGVPFVAAKPGDTISIYGLGCGPTQPADTGGR